MSELAAPIWKRAWRYAVSNGVPRRSLYVALVVGSVLNLINQGDALLGAGSLNWFKIALTYSVPYFVCTYGAVSSQIAQSPAGLRGFEPEERMRGTKPIDSD